MTLRSTRSLLARFMAVGGAGFALDALSFQLLFSAGGGLVVSRLASAAIAITLTWFLNRHFVFRTHAINRMGAEYSRYLAVQTVGLAVNFGVYFLMLDVFTPLQTVPIVALAAGAAAALAFNFLGARLWAFRLESARPTLSDRQ